VENNLGRHIEDSRLVKEGKRTLLQMVSDGCTWTIVIGLVNERLLGRSGTKGKREWVEDGWNTVSEIGCRKSQEEVVRVCLHSS
jgi:hypothetical protein